MARIIDFKIDEEIREKVRQEFMALDVERRDYPGLAAIYGVQPKTFEGWLEGRGNPVPKACIGKYLLQGEIPDTWAERIITGLLSRGSIQQRGSRGQHDTFTDDIGAASLPVVLDRVKQFLTRDTGDDWVDAKWRRIELVPSGSGTFELYIEYARGDSGEEAQ